MNHDEIATHNECVHQLKRIIEILEDEDSVDVTLQIYAITVSVINVLIKM